MPTRAGELWRGVREDWVPELWGRWAKWRGSCGGRAGWNVYLHSKLFFYGSWRVFFYRIWKSIYLYIKVHLARWKTVATVSLKFQWLYGIMLMKKVTMSKSYQFDDFYDCQNRKVTRKLQVKFSCNMILQRKKEK